MTSLRQIESNRRNGLKSTGPKTESGKQRSSQNAVRHGLTAETVIKPLEDADDYKAFELAMTADFDGESAVVRELIVRLASLFWRLRRATSIETGLLEIQSEILREHRRARKTQPASSGGAATTILPLDHGIACVLSDRDWDEMVSPPATSPAELQSRRISNHRVTRSTLRASFYVSPTSTAVCSIGLVGMRLASGVKSGKRSLPCKNFNGPRWTPPKRHENACGVVCLRIPKEISNSSRFCADLRSLL